MVARKRIKKSTTPIVESRNVEKSNASRNFRRECKELIKINVDLRRIKTVTTKSSNVSLKRLRTQKNTIHGRVGSVEREYRDKEKSLC